MKIKIPSVIFYGTLKFLFYIVLPLLIISLLETYIPIMEFSDAFVLGIIIIGVIGTILTVLTHTFKKDTVAHGYTKIIDSIYSAIFTFYIFGGFTVGDGFGNFFINTSLAGIAFSARIGIQVIAYLTMIGSLISVGRYIFKTAELKKNKEYNITIKRKFQASKAFYVAGLVTSIILTVYIISIPLSAINIRANLEGDGFDFDFDLGPDPLNLTDGDTVTMYLQFSIHNYGAWSIFDVRLDVDIKLPNSTRIGGSPDRDYNFLHYTSTTSENFSMSIDPVYVPYLVVTATDLLFELSFEGRYAQINLDADLTFTLPWENVTYIP
jgi:hypothetical protein